ncbi:hypothetical protein [Bifidobacterium sp. SO1]|uniref:hypothetical protein n=1 Tax=Bifidobacterium sp. SO1 TaxID=2809029 RepID=UPI001BDC9545|nr:hypothetical protein [Bifidobacterium sp. SO1]MBT1162903.1 hypothetical protein [Bifidobacterium sp. SO1]
MTGENNNETPYEETYHVQVHYFYDTFTSVCDELRQSVYVDLYKGKTRIDSLSVKWEGDLYSSGRRDPVNELNVSYGDRSRSQNDLRVPPDFDVDKYLDSRLQADRQRMNQSEKNCPVYLSVVTGFWFF